MNTVSVELREGDRPVEAFATEGHITVWVEGFDVEVYPGEAESSDPAALDKPAVQRVRKALAEDAVRAAVEQLQHAITLLTPIGAGTGAALDLLHTSLVRAQLAQGAVRAVETR